MLVKIMVSLKYNTTPLEGDIDLFIDEIFWKTIKTVGGTHTETIDIAGNYLTAFYDGTYDYEPAQATMSIPKKPKPRVEHLGFQPYHIFTPRAQ